MEQFLLEDKCQVNTNKGIDNFVGIKCDNGIISVSFPLGYHLEEGKATRDDVFLLIRTLSRNCDHKKSEVAQSENDFHDNIEFPMASYLYLIRDFKEHGYYKETDIQYKTAKRGKIDWARTIKTQKPYIQNGNAVYLNFVTKKTSMNDDQLITLIHEYCVYESYKQMGWLFTKHMPAKPRIKFQPTLFKSVIREKLNSTFNDRDRELFQNMYAIVSDLGDNQTDNSFTYGTTDFESVWEHMVNRLYGVPDSDKEKYFPKTFWVIDDNPGRNSSLKPDTIMLWKDDNAYVLDSKYYKYGSTGKPEDLPQSASVSKQIIYGEHIANNWDFEHVYNAFILPFDAGERNAEKIKYIGYAGSDWKSNDKTYEKILGYLLDVKYLMEKSTEKDDEEIKKLAEQIKSDVK